MQKKEPNDPKSPKKTPAPKKEEKSDLAIIKTAPDSPIQEVMCLKEHKKLFEGLCTGKKPL